jgi:hypothetical protein
MAAAGRFPVVCKADRGLRVLLAVLTV